MTSVTTTKFCQWARKHHGSMRDTGCLGLVHWDDPEGWYWGGRREEGSGWGTHVYLWRIHFDIWQN